MTATRLFKTTMPTVSVDDVSYAAAVYVARRMRAADVEEIEPLISSAEDLALRASLSAYGKVASFNGKPVSVFGASETVPSCWQVFMFATDDWSLVSGTVTKHIKRTMSRYLYDMGANRLECRALDTHTDAHAWLKFLGAKKESEIEEYGANARTYFMFRWLRSEYQEK